MLVINYNGGRPAFQSFRGHIFPRWGRPEEEWLDDNNFLLAERVTDPSLENFLSPLLHDLNIAFDRDRNCWIPSRGETRTEYNPDWSDISALDGLDLSPFPQLGEIDKA